MKKNIHEKSLSLRSVFHLCLRHFTLAILTTVVLSGCNSGGGGEGGSGTSGGGSSNVAIATSSLATGVVSLDTSTASLIIASDASSVTFAGTPAAVLALQPGSIFLVGNTARKVESVISGGGQTVVRTVEPDLSEALDALQISGDVFLGSEHISQASTLAGVRVDIINQKDTTVGTISESNQGNTFIITIADEVIYDADGDLSTKLDQVIANGTVVLEKPHVAFNFTYGLFSEKYTSINFTAGEKVDITVSSQNIQFDKKKTITLFKYYVPIPITGGFAGVTIPVNLVFEASGKAAIIAGFSQDISIDVGMKATISPNTVTSTSNFTHTFSFKQPQIEGTLSGSIAINPDVDLTAFQYSLAGITNSLGAVATAKGSITLSDACARVTADAFVSSIGFVMVPKASLDIDFSLSGIKIDADLGLVSLNKEIYSYTKNIYDSGDVCLVSNDPPVANAGLDLSSNTNAKVYLDGLKSSDSDGLVASYLWTQVSGTSVALTAADSATPTFTAPTTPGTLTFRLTVTDNKGATGTDDVNVVVYAGDTNKKPNANAGNDQFVVSGSPVALDAGGSYDPDGSIVAYLWEQTGGPGVALIGANTASPSFTAPSISTVLVFKLTVKDNKGAVGTDYASISVVSGVADTTAPTVNTTTPVNAASGVSINSGVSVTFSEALDASTINTSTFTLNGPSGLVAGTVTYNTTTNTATFTPSAALAYNTTYTATITTGVKDLAGNPLASNYSWSFTTISSPSAAPSAPTGVNATAGNGQVTVSWNATAGVTYNLYMASISGVTKITYSGLPDGMKHSGVTSPYLHTGLTNGKTYYFVVTAVNANGESGESSQISTTPQATSIKVWGTPQLIETGNTPTSSPKIAMDANGNAIAVWHQSTLNGAGYSNSVYANRYTAGTGWGSETIIGGNSTQYGGSPSSNNVDPPRIAIAGDGTAIALWIQRDASSFNTSSACYANRYVPGQGWGTAQMVVPNVSSIASIQVAADATGNAIAVCPQYVGASQSIFAARYTTGQGWGTALQISSTGIPSSSGAYEPHIAIDSNGNAIAVWAQWDGVAHNLYTNRYNASLGWETAQLLQTGTGLQFSWGSGNSPNIAIDSSGNAMVVWGQFNGGYRIFSKRYTVVQGWGAAQIIDASVVDPNNYYAYRPQIAMDNNGNAIAVWEQPLPSSSSYNAWSNRYVAGQGWETAVAIENSTYSGAALNPQIAMSANGDAVAVWHKVGDMWANRFIAGQGWGTAVVIETSTAAARDPQVVIDASGYAIAVWRQYDGVTDSIWANRLQSSQLTQCSDGVDNDGDLKIDAADPGCWDSTGAYNPLDNTERTFTVGEF